MGPISPPRQVRRSAGAGWVPGCGLRRDNSIDGIRLTRPPDAIAYSCDHVVRFLRGAREGNSLLYHGGDLALDASNDPGVRTKQRYVLIASDCGLLHLSQARVDVGFSHYYAIRTDDPLSAAPKKVLDGKLDPSDYIALLAISERQAAQSVARAIRDALGVRDDQAATVRNDFIRRGWLTNGRFPELTAAGHALLA